MFYHIIKYVFVNFVDLNWQKQFMLQNVELPDSFSKSLKDLLEGLLQRDINERIGCRGRG